MDKGGRKIYKAGEVSRAVLLSTFRQRRARDRKAVLILFCVVFIAKKI